MFSFAKLDGELWRHCAVGCFINTAAGRARKKKTKQFVFETLEEIWIFYWEPFGTLWNLIQPIKVSFMISICRILSSTDNFRWGFNRSSRICYLFPLLPLALYSRRARAQRPHPRPLHGPVLKDKTGRKSLRHVISRPKRTEDNSTNQQRKKHTRHCGKQTRWIFLTTITGEAVFEVFNKWRVLDIFMNILNGFKS